MKPWRRRLFGIDIAEVRFQRRGFHTGRPEARERLEQIGERFLAGYHAALEERASSGLASRLEAVDAEQRGFAYEGAAMALAIKDAIFRSSRLDAFLSGPASRHIYMAHIGAGWAYARLPWPRIERAIRSFDSLLGWLAVDGYGFHQGYFHPQRFIQDREMPARLSADGLSAFDNGLGRSVWFFAGADVDRTGSAVARFPRDRRADIWAGVGLACAYAGGVPRADLVALRRMAEFVEALAQGAAFAAKARQFAGNPAPHTEMACEVFCRMSSADCAVVTDCALQEVRNLSAPSYRAWRHTVQRHLSRVLAA